MSGELWAAQAKQWREPEQICSQWSEAASLEPALLETSASRGWWELLESLGITLLVTREYEHLAVAMSAHKGKSRLSYLPVPHPSGLAVDRQTNRVWLASTRNPNQVYQLRPATDVLERGDGPEGSPHRIAEQNPLVPVVSAFYPGSLYLHDLALIGGKLYGNTVGHNAVSRLAPDGTFDRVWWPKSIERNFGATIGQPDHRRNYIQLNSIAGGSTIGSSYFTASSAGPGKYRPGDLRYAVDRRGVLFSGRTREPVCTGLTRPHSARLDGRQIWIANSGYGEVVVAAKGDADVAIRLPGWTRGLCICGDVVFAGTSRVLSGYEAYAPGVDPQRSVCGVHAFSKTTGKTLASVEWPAGNQIFAIDWISDSATRGFAFLPEGALGEHQKAFFYSYLAK